MRYRPLNPGEKAGFCTLMRGFVPIARESTHPLREVARKQIALAMWHWTGDAFDTRDNVVKQGLFKYNIDLLPASIEAVELKAAGALKRLRHEHAVPRTWLADVIIQRDLCVEDIQRILTRCCHAVIVTKEEDRKLVPRRAMPAGWDPDSGNPFERYLAAGLISKIKNLPVEWRAT